MQIIGGRARSIVLDTVDSLEIRPTSARARKAMFDSLGDFTDAIIVDLCAGAGSLGLEAASRGACKVFMFEKNIRHCKVIEKNIEKVLRTGVSADIKVTNGDVNNVSRILNNADNPDLIFADPPYHISGDIFSNLINDENFVNWVGDALIVWEIPDTAGAVGKFMEHKEKFTEFNLRKFGSTIFLIAQLSD